MFRRFVHEMRLKKIATFVFEYGVRTNTTRVLPTEGRASICSDNENNIGVGNMQWMKWESSEGYQRR